MLIKLPGSTLAIQTANSTVRLYILLLHAPAGLRTVYLAQAKAKRHSAFPQINCISLLQLHKKCTQCRETLICLMSSSSQLQAVVKYQHELPVPASCPAAVVLARPLLAGDTAGSSQ